MCLKLLKLSQNLISIIIKKSLVHTKMEWTEVTAPKKKQSKKPKNQDDDSYHYGGYQGGHLKAGAVQGNAISSGKGSKPAEHHASIVADADYLRDENEEIKYETYSHECAIAVQNARMAKDWSQAELAKKVNEKTGAIVDLENGSGKYNADLVNRCERVLGVKIPRGRK